MRQDMLKGTVMKLSAYHYFSDLDITAGAEVPAHLIPTDERLAGGLYSSLLISQGSRVMLMRNIMTETGVVMVSWGLLLIFRCLALRLYLS